MHCQQFILGPEVDIAPATFNLDGAAVRRALSRRARVAGAPVYPELTEPQPIYVVEGSAAIPCLGANQRSRSESSDANLYDSSMASLETEEARIQAAYGRRVGGAQRYSWFEAGHLFMVQQVERAMLRALRGAGITQLADKEILEIGCGNGHWLRELIKWGAAPEKLTGIDLLADRLARARRLSAPAVVFHRGNGAALEFADGSFDMVLQATVFTSILDATLKARLGGEILRVLRPGGIVLWYDFRFDNPNNPDVRGIGQQEINRLFPDCHARLVPTTLLPPLARCLAPRSWLACCLVSALPWTCSHYVGVLRKIIV